MKFVSSIEALSQLVASNSKEPILVGGELVLLSHDKAAAADIGSLTDRYIAQPPRMASRKNIFDKGKKSLYVSIDRQAVEMILAYKGQVTLSADQYLAYGLSQKKNVIVIGGGESSVQDNVSLEGYVFTDQSLVDTFDKTTPLSGYMLEIVLKDIVAEYPDHYIHWCKPLDTMPSCDVSQSLRFVDAGNDALKNIVKRKVYSRKQSEEESWGLLPALGIAILGFSVFAGATGFQWKQLEAERAEYHREVSGYEDAYQNSAHSLELLRHRDFLMSEQSGSTVKVALLDSLIEKVSTIKDVLIHQIRVIDQDAVNSFEEGRAGDLFVLDLSVPKEGVKEGAREQAEKLVKLINAQLGMTVRVISHADYSHKYGESEIKYWRYTLGGSQ